MKQRKTRGRKRKIEWSEATRTGYRHEVYFDGIFRFSIHRNKKGQFCKRKCFLISLAKVGLVDEDLPDGFEDNFEDTNEPLEEQEGGS